MCLASPRIEHGATLSLECGGWPGSRETSVVNPWRQVTLWSALVARQRGADGRHRDVPDGCVGLAHSLPPPPEETAP